MQPPPRKVKPTIQLKNIQAEQITKLQQKHQQDLDLLEDIRQFSKQRSALEKEYAQGLQKLSQQFLTKREFKPQPDITTDDGLQHLAVLSVWKTILEETKRVAEARLLAADTYSLQIIKPVGPLKNNKSNISKKVMDHIAILQKDLSQTVQDMVKAQKVYSDDEHLAHEARVKAAEAEEKVKNKSTGIFTSLSTLQRSSAKLCSRREQCEVKATASRNDYLLSLSAANANHARYLNTDLADLIKILDGEMYDNIREYFGVFGKVELECCGTTQECFTKILHDAHLINGNFNQQCFLKENLVLNSLVQYKFQPMDNDQITEVRGDHGASPQLSKEAHKWAAKVAKEKKVIHDNTKVLQNMQANGNRKPSETSQEGNNNADVETKDLKEEDICQIIRRAETSRIRAEARLEVLKNAGVNIEEVMAAVQAEIQVSPAAEAGQLSRTSSTSAKSDSSGPKENISSEEVQSTTDVPNDSTYINYDDYDDEFVDDGFDSSAGIMMGADTTSVYSSGRIYPLKAVALYDFQANNADELFLKEGEHLELVADGDGDGWVRARSLDGNTGFIPENYIQMLDSNTLSSPTGDDTSVTEVAVQDTLLSSPIDCATLQAGDHSSVYSASDYEVQAATVPQDLPLLSEGIWARAMYDYEATAEEELTFHEGQLIKVLRKDENGIDDGWWEGEVNGRVGVFPSLVVEELSAEGMNMGDVSSPIQTGPPPFTPPAPGPPPAYSDISQQSPPQVEITQPTPDDMPNFPQIAPPVDESPATVESADQPSALHEAVLADHDQPTSQQTAHIEGDGCNVQQNVSYQSPSEQEYITKYKTCSQFTIGSDINHCVATRESSI